MKYDLGAANLKTPSPFTGLGIGQSVHPSLFLSLLPAPVPRAICFHHHRFSWLPCTTCALLGDGGNIGVEGDTSCQHMIGLREFHMHTHNVAPLFYFFFPPH